MAKTNHDFVQLTSYCKQNKNRFLVTQLCLLLRWSGLSSARCGPRVGGRPQRPIDLCCERSLCPIRVRGPCLGLGSRSRGAGDPRSPSATRPADSGPLRAANRVLGAGSGRGRWELGQSAIGGGAGLTRPANRRRPASLPEQADSGRVQPRVTVVAELRATAMAAAMAATTAERAVLVRSGRASGRAGGFSGATGREVTAGGRPVLSPQEEEFRWLLHDEVHAVLKQLQDILKVTQRTRPPRVPAVPAATQPGPRAWSRRQLPREPAAGNPACRASQDPSPVSMIKSLHRSEPPREIAWLWYREMCPGRPSWDPGWQGPGRD